MTLWTGEKFSGTGRQVLGIERDEVSNHVRACKPVPMNIHCNDCNNNWNPAFTPQSVFSSYAAASVTCPKCQATGYLKSSD